MTRKQYNYLMKQFDEQRHKFAGLKVIITNDKRKRKYHGTLNAVGTIVNTSSGSEFGIKLEGFYNTASSKGLFWFRSDEFDIVDEMEGINMVAVKGNYKVAMVNFLQGTNTTKKYAFALFEDDIKVDDCVLCDTSNGYGVAKVVDIINQDEYDGTTVTKEIICKVDFSAFENRKETRKRQEVIKKQMDNLVKQNQELVLYEMIAKQSPEMAAMLEEYKQLMTV